MNIRFSQVILFFLIFFILNSCGVYAQGDIQHSDKKTLFIFPISYAYKARNTPDKHKKWLSEKLLKTFVTDFERFDFVEMPAGSNLDEFLEDADKYLGEHAREIAQKYVDRDGRIREARVTLDDLKKAVENGYAFAPRFKKIKKTETKKEKKKKKVISYEIDAHFDIYRTVDRKKIARIKGSSSGVGGLLGIFHGFVENIGIFNDDTSQFRATAEGVYQEIKTRIRQMDEFSLKAQVVSSNFNSFKIGIGKDFGVKLDRRYRVWELDSGGRKSKSIAFGKVRKILPKESNIQILIGTAPRGSQVIEDAKFGLSVIPHVGMLPFETKGFDQFGDGFILRLSPDEIAWTYDLPRDESGSKFSIGVNLQYNIAWLTGQSELYLTIDGSLVPMMDLAVYNAMLGIEKKYYFRRLAVFGAVKYGIFGANFNEVEFFDDPDVEEAADAEIWGVGADIGGELLVTPNVALQARLGYIVFPEQTVLTAYDFSDNKFKSASIRAVGLTYKLSLLFTI